MAEFDSYDLKNRLINCRAANFMLLLQAAQSVAQAGRLGVEDGPLHNG